MVVWDGQLIISGDLVINLLLDESSGFIHEESYVVEVEVDESIGFVDRVSAEVSTTNNMPELSKGFI